MSITPSGSVSDTVASDGDLWIGVSGNGSLNVDGGSVKSVTAAGAASAGAEARLWVGRPTANNAPAGNGTVTLSGAASVLEVLSGGRADAGATAQIGRGGTGNVSVSSGATLRIADTVGTAFNYSSGDGNEALNVGRDASGNGTLTSDNGHVIISGTGSRLNVGRDGGIGTVSIVNNSTLDMSSTVAAADTGLAIGRAGGNGSMLISQSSVTLTAGGAAATSTEDYGAYVQVGREAGGVGSLSLQASASLTLSGDSNIAGTPGSYTSLIVGRDGGSGLLTAIGGSSITLNNSPEGAYLWVARSALTSGTTSGGLGLMNSTITLDSAGAAFFGVGRGTGTDGFASVGPGSAISVKGNSGAQLMVGIANNSAGSTGGLGEIEIVQTPGSGLAAGAVTIQSDSGSANASIGQVGGTGKIDVDGGTLRLDGATFANVQLGVQFDGAQPGGVATGSAGTGSLLLSNGARFYMADGTGSNSLTLGGGVGAATMEIRSGGVANLDEGDATASTYVGVGSGISGSGAATLLVSGAGSRLEGVASITIGRNTFNSNSLGGNGSLIVENGGTVAVGQSILVGEGGRLSGDGGTLQFQSGGGVNVWGGKLGDASGAIQHLAVNGTLSLLGGANASFDISSATHDRITVQSASGSGFSALVGNANFDLNVLGGYKFAAGESRTLIDGSGVNINISESFAGSAATISGQNIDFSYYLGVLSGGTSFGVTALNSGTTGGSSSLDFGASQTQSGSYLHVASAGNAAVKGGVMGVGGLAVGVDSVAGTLAGDIFNAAQATQAMVFYGRGGNDVLTGGSGRDTAVYAAQRSAATITRNSDGTVTVSSAADGADTLRSIERLQFADQAVSLALAKGDLSGDGASDILWRNANGAVAAWSVSGSQARTDLGNPGPNWNIAGTGDFDGDGINDILWRDSTGQDTIWRMVDGQHVGGYGLTPVDTSWNVAGIGDFDGDGTSDILWRNADGSDAIWKMQDGQHVGGYGMIQVGTTWGIAGVGDFNGDSTSDVLWRNENGNVQVWTMQSGQHVGGTDLGDVDSNWAIRGVADFTGDGTADILWQRSTGEIQVWAMQNGQRTGGGFIETVADPTWRIVGTGDYNSDGTADILWRNTGSGHNTIWTMQNGQHTGGFAVETVPDQTWSISQV